MRSVTILMAGIFKVSYHKMCGHSEDLHSSLSQFFPSDPCVRLQNLRSGNESLQVPDRPMGLAVTEYAMRTDVVSDATLQRTFEKPPCVEFWCSIYRGYASMPPATRVCSWPFFKFLNQNNLSQRTECKRHN
jgi:hypothetical protein